MPLSEIFGSTSFRTAALAAAAFAAVTLLLFGFIFWQTAGLETQLLDRFIRHEFAALAREDAAALRIDVNSRYRADLHRQSFAAVFDAAGKPVAGGLAAMPEGLPADGLPHEVIAARREEHGVTLERVRAAAGLLAGGDLLVMGRSEEDSARLRRLLARAMALGLLPALAASLAIGVFASNRALARVRAMNRAIGRIMQGYLSERLPSGGTIDTLDRLADSCNLMLAEIERLVGEVKAVSDNIAHDLRAPLTRLRARLEIGRARARSHAELDAVLAEGLADLDRSLAIMAALLRIGEVETNRRREGFRAVSLSGLVTEAAELYAPMAEDRGLSFTCTLSPDQIVQADRDLLFEAVVNLLDNAVKFAPPGGAVGVALRLEPSGPVISVSDSGAGIPKAQREAALKRFQRGTPLPHIVGSGLGLSLVAAILRLHDFDLRMADGAAGFAMEIVCIADREAKKALVFAKNKQKTFDSLADDRG